MKIALRVLALCLPVVAGFAQASASLPRPPDAVVENRGFHLDLLPKAFTANPTLEMTVYSERTDYGRTLPEASPQTPVYYVSHSDGFHQMGAVMGGEHSPMPEELEQTFRRTLTERGYLPASDQGHPPALMLNYFWGSHAALEPELAQMFRELNEQNIIERALLVGGRFYARELRHEMEFGRTILGGTLKRDYLRYQAAHDLYYVVVSAYDFKSVASGERKLAWRTTMTVNAQGVAMKESLPPLIYSGGFYLGRDSGEPMAIRRDVQRGTVKLGPLRIIEEDVKLPKPPEKTK
jgi:hypothetical protein